jgi:hypothetical protein
MNTIGATSPYFTKRRLTILLSLLLSFIALLLNSSVSAEATSPSSPTAYYVAPDGNNNHSGAIDKPWRTIKFAASNPLLQPGDTVYVRDGVYDEYIQTKVSGTAANPLTFRNYPGEQPVITGNGSWRWHVLDQSHIRIEGFTFRNFGKGGVQVRTRDTDMTDVIIRNCTFENQEQYENDGAKTVHLTTTVSGYELSDVRVEGNNFQNIDSGDHPSLQIAGNVSGVKVIDNTFNETSSITIGVAGRADIGQPEQILIKGNEISAHGSPGKHSAGIYLDGAGERIVIEENIVHDGQQGIKVDLEPAANDLNTRFIIVRRNILYNNDQINLKLGVGTPSDDCRRVGSLEKSVAVHNTIFSDIPDATNIRFSCGSHLRWKNNLLAYVEAREGFQYKFGNDTVNSTTWQLNYNFFHETNGNKAFRWDLTTYDSFAAYQAGTGREPHSKKGNAIFVNVEQRQFEMVSGSEAVDAGGPLTYVEGDGSGQVMGVEEAWYFSDGMGLQAGDSIRVGDNTAVTVTDVDYTQHTLTLDRNISWSDNDPVYYDFANAAPDAGADEHFPSLFLHVTAGDGQAQLSWETSVALPDAIEWQIEYSGPIGDQPNTIPALPANTRFYELTGLTNYHAYQVSVKALADGRVLLSQVSTVTPTDIFLYLPLTVFSQ